MKRDHEYLFGLAAICLVVLGGISAGAILKTIPNDSQTLLGTLVAGLLLFSRDIVSTIRSAWSDERTGQLTDHLAGSAPAKVDAPTGNVDDPIHTVEEPKP